MRQVVEGVKCMNEGIKTEQKAVNAVMEERSSKIEKKLMSKMDQK